MTTPTFPTSIQPTYNTVKSSQPRVNVAQFGSGYAQRAIFGINNNPKQYQLTFNVSETDADTIETFQIGRASKIGRAHVSSGKLFLEPLIRMMRLLFFASNQRQETLGLDLLNLLGRSILLSPLPKAQPQDRLHGNQLAQFTKNFTL
jgi:hypothetical protein